MKKNLPFAAALLTSLLFAACSTTVNSDVNVYNKGINLPDWQWTSGEVRRDSIAVKQAFTISFNNSIYHPGDSVKITFNSYNVTLSGITDATTFTKWTSRNMLLCSTKHEIRDVWTWQFLVKDTNARINKPFTGMNNNRSDELTNYQIRSVVPATLSMALTVSPGSCTMYDINGHDKPIFTKGYQTLTTTIKGIMVEKL